MYDLSMITAAVMVIFGAVPPLIFGIFLMISWLRSDTLQLKERTLRLERELHATRLELQLAKGR